jgi:hypothetical protein
MPASSDHIIREQLIEIEAMEKKLASMKRALHIALGDVRPSEKVVEFVAWDGTKSVIKAGGKRVGRKRKRELVL